MIELVCKNNKQHFLKFLLQGLSLEHVITVLATKYNSGETPAFNMDLDVEEELPKDFTILPGWNKQLKTKR